jgi:PHD/YefM family antitoxin component YafN of YafNO toxin-antitoxin module
MVTMTEHEAKSQFNDILESVAREPVAVTRDGVAIAFIISRRDMEDLIALREAKRQQARADWEAWSERARHHVSPEAQLLTDEDVVRMVHEAREEIAREDREKS